MKILKLFLLFFCVFVLSAVVSYPTHAKKPKVRSSEVRDGKCKNQNKFTPNDDVFLVGKGLKPLSNYDIYITSNKEWTGGEELIDVKSGVPMTITTNDKGKLKCRTIWRPPSIPGTYDIVLDCLDDGIIGKFDPGIDAIDGKKKNPGFRVEEIEGNPSVVSIRKKKGKCKRLDVFKLGQEIRVKGKDFTPDTQVDIFVVADQDWTFGDIIGPDLSSDKETIAIISSSGKLKCVKLGSTEAGTFDIVVDANGDGTFNSGDAVDGMRGHGFKVK
ncbi:MAG: hypothetical protein ACUZ77_08655 [Candidatus Brocadiales bacterium]